LPIAARIAVEYLGFPAASGPGAGCSWGAQGAGASYGGRGGHHSSGFAAGEPYGSPNAPVDLGSGGGGSAGGAGGGLIRLEVQGCLTIDGEVSADGAEGTPGIGAGGGSGGTLYVDAGQLVGSGAFHAAGGDGSTHPAGYKGGGGGGGRIAIYTADLQMNPAQITAAGGVGYEHGGAGTVFFGSLCITIAQQPVGGIVGIGEPVTLSISATGQGTLDYHWRKNGESLTENPPHVTGTQTDTLHIDAAASADQGDYDVWLTDDCGDLVSGAAHLSVVLRGDLNCDGVVNGQDIDGFILVLFGAPPYTDYYDWSGIVSPPCNAYNGDMNGDGAVNGQDIDGFVAVLFG